MWRLENLVISTEYKAVIFVVNPHTALENLVISTEYKAWTARHFMPKRLENLVISTEYKAKPFCCNGRM